MAKCLLCSGCRPCKPRHGFIEELPQKCMCTMSNCHSFFGGEFNALLVGAAILVGGFPQHKLLLCPHESQAKPSHITLSFKPINVTLQNAYQVGGLVGEWVASSLRGVTPRLCDSLELLM